MTSQDIQIHRMTRKLCNQAFSEFKKGIESTFPERDYQTLRSLTLKSSEKLFFLNLKEKIQAIFSTQVLEDLTPQSTSADLHCASRISLADYPAPK